MLPNLLQCKCLQEARYLAYPRVTLVLLYRLPASTQTRAQTALHPKARYCTRPGGTAILTMLIFACMFFFLLSVCLSVVGSFVFMIPLWNDCILGGFLCSALAIILLFPPSSVKGSGWRWQPSYASTQLSFPFRALNHGQISNLDSSEASWGPLGVYGGTSLQSNVCCVAFRCRPRWDLFIKGLMSTIGCSWAIRSALIEEVKVAACSHICVMLPVHDQLEKEKDTVCPVEEDMLSISHSQAKLTSQNWMALFSYCKPARQNSVKECGEEAVPFGSQQELDKNVLFLFVSVL